MYKDSYSILPFLFLRVLCYKKFCCCPERYYKWKLALNKKVNIGGRLFYVFHFSPGPTAYVVDIIPK